MVITPHLLIGAAIGSKVKNTGWIVVLAVLSNILLDKIPHWDYPPKSLRSSVRNKNFKAILLFFLMILGDTLIGILILGIALYINPSNLNRLMFIILGILSSLILDILAGCGTLIGGINKKFQKIADLYIDFHENVIHSPKKIKKPTLLGVGSQILITLIGVLIILL